MKIVRDGVYYACGLTLGGLALGWMLNAWAGLPLYVLAAFCLYFFRDPDRQAPAGNLLLAPADGKVVAVRELDGGETRVSIFLNIFDVHVNRTPIPGKVTAVVYQKGRFINASHDAASDENEQNTLIIEGERTRVTCRQIAGLIARRIVCYKSAGDEVKQAERIGYIKFGSRVDVIYGREWKTTVAAGKRVSAGSSVLAEWRNPEERP